MKEIQRLLTLIEANSILVSNTQELISRTGYEGKEKLQAIQNNLNVLVEERNNLLQQLNEKYKEELNKKK